MKDTTIINLFGAPGVGKTTAANGLTYELKRRGFLCDCPYEFAKSLSWVNDVHNQRDQLYILANQHNSIVRSFGKVDYIILDSPVLLSLVYQQYNAKKFGADTFPIGLYDGYFHNFVIELHKKYKSLNFLLSRDVSTDYSVLERFHGQDDSIEIRSIIERVLNYSNVEYYSVSGGDIVDDILIEMGVI